MQVQQFSCHRHDDFTKSRSGKLLKQQIKSQLDTFSLGVVLIASLRAQQILQTL